jgi:hypothetical protein
MARKPRDEGTQRWPIDSTCVKIDQAEELAFWSSRFRVSAGMLRQAVRAVGSKFKDVQFFLDSRRNPRST